MQAHDVQDRRQASRSIPAASGGAEPTMQDSQAESVRSPAPPPTTERGAPSHSSTHQSQQHGEEIDLELDFQAPLNQGVDPPVSCPTANAAEVADGHEWTNIEGRWICKTCMSTSRAIFPPKGRCPGLTPALAEIVRNPRGHTLQIATHTDGRGVVIICSRCGHFAASNRRNTKLHTHDCTYGFESDGAKYSYRRFCNRQHPTYGRGEAKVLEAAFPVAALGAGRFAAAPGVTNPPHAPP